MRKLFAFLRWPSPRNRHARVLDGAVLLGIVGACLYLNSELVAIATGFVWSVSGYLHLADTAIFLLTAAVGLPLVWLCGLVAILVFNAETDPENN